MSRHRILFLTQVLPYPLDAGPKIRAYHVLSWLAERFDVHLVSFVRPDDPPSALNHLAGICAGVTTVPMRRSRIANALQLAAALVRGRSFILERDESRAMRHAIRREMAQGFAAVHADQLWMARFARDVPIPLKVLDNHNAVFRIVERLAANEANPLKRVLLSREARLIAAEEVRTAGAFDSTLFVSKADLDAVRSMAGREALQRLANRARMMPICLDTAAQQPVVRRADAHRVTVLATMYWPPNAEGALWLGREVWARVLAAADGMSRTPVLTIIGKRPPDSIRALVRQFPGTVEVVGYVDDPTPYLEQTAAFVVPLLSGGGMRVKILDAWAWGLPIVSTTVGAEGIDVGDGRDILLADDPDSFAGCVTRLLVDPQLGDRIGAAGRASVAAHYDRAKEYEVLADVYAGLL